MRRALKNIDRCGTHLKVYSLFDILNSLLYAEKQLGSIYERLTRTVIKKKGKVDLRKRIITPLEGETKLSKLSRLETIQLLLETLSVRQTFYE